MALGVLPDGTRDIPGLWIENTEGAVFPATTLQTCIVHLIRNSLDYASWKDRRALAGAIRPIYMAASAEAAQAEPDTFEQGE